MMRRTQVICLVIAIILCVGTARSDDWMPRVFSILTGVLAVCLLFFPETQIDLGRRQVIRVVRLLGVILVSRRERPLSDFEGVRCYLQSNTDTMDNWLVTLRPHEGRDVIFRQFSVSSGQECPEAKAFAQELSNWTGLKLI